MKLTASLLFSLLISFPAFSQEYGSGSSRLAWDAPVGDPQLQEYRLYFSEDCTLSGSEIMQTPVFAVVDAATTTSESLEAMGVVAGQEYCSVVSAVNMAGDESGPSNVLQLMMLDTPGSPDSLRIDRPGGSVLIHIDMCPAQGQGSC